MTPAERIANGTPLYIPVPSGPYTSQRIALDGRVYTMRLSWNMLAESWYLGIADSEDDPILNGLRIVPNLPLLRFYRYEDRLPPGEIVAQDMTGDGSPPGYDDFGIGKRVELIYYAQSVTR